MLDPEIFKLPPSTSDEEIAERLATYLTREKSRKGLIRLSVIDRRDEPRYAGSGWLETADRDAARSWAITRLLAGCDIAPALEYRTANPVSIEQVRRALRAKGKGAR